MSNTILFGRPNQLFGTGARMNDRAKSVGKRVREAREARDWSQKDLADAIGVRQNTIATIETGKTKKSRWVPDIERVLEISLREPEDTLRSNALTRTIPGNKLVGDEDLPLYGSAEAGDGIVVMTTGPIDSVRRPHSLARVKDAYGVIVVGESMVPVLRPGDIALVNPHVPPRPEDPCIFIREEHGEFTATIKEYVGQTKDYWKVKRYKPKEEEFQLKKRDWPRVDVIVGRYLRR